MSVIIEGNIENKISRCLCKIFKKHHTNDDNNAKGVVDIYLRRTIDCSFGIGLTGGTDQLHPPSITFLRPGSVAHVSDQLRVGEQLKLVNGIALNDLTHEQVMTLLRNSGNCVYLQVEYNLNDNDFKQPSNTRLASADIRLMKENNRVGVTLRGGAYGPDRKKSRPLTIMNIRTGSPAHREKRLRIGDRVLGINGADVFNATLAAAQKLLFEAVNTVVLTVEYYINIIDMTYRNSDHVCVKIEKDFSLDIGIELICEIDHTNKTTYAFFIDHLVPASAADRCGALFPGDQIIAINGCKLDFIPFSDVNRLLQTPLPTVYLEIIPANHIRGKQFLPLTKICIVNDCSLNALKYRKHSGGDVYQQSITLSSETASYSFNFSKSINRLTMLRRSFMKHKSSKTNGIKQDEGVNIKMLPNKAKFSNNMVTRRAASVEGTMSRVPCGRICHQERMEVTLHSYARGSFGLVVHDQISKSHLSQPKRRPLFISYMEKNSPAERSGVLQVGDRIIAINDWSSINGTAEEGNQILRQATSPLKLFVEFDVIESALPFDGVFDVKLAKRGNNLGIVVRSEAENTKGEPVIISDVQVGSVAYRCGSLHSGDRILAVDNILLESCTVEEAMRLLQRTGDIVKLRVRKGVTSGQENHDAAQSLIYSIELNRNGGPLGITIASSDERYEPVLISYLAPGGLAEKTGALRIGDRILAVNNESVEGIKAADVMHLLQQCTDPVTIKIMRIFDPSTTHSTGSWHLSNSSQIDRIRLQHNIAMSDSYSETSEKISTPIQSIDSAVESLDDSPGNIPKYHSDTQRYVIDEQLPNTSLNYVEEQIDYERINYPSGSAHSSGLSGPFSGESRKKPSVYWMEQGQGQGQGQWERNLNLPTDKSHSQRCDCHKTTNLEPENWIEVLEALETVGEVAMLQKLEECTTGSGNGTTTTLHTHTHSTPLITRLSCGDHIGRQLYPFTSSTAHPVLSPSVNPKFPKSTIQQNQYSSNDGMDSLSLSNDSQTSTSLCDISYMVPPKPPRYGISDIHALSVLSEPSNARSITSGGITSRPMHELSKSKNIKLSPQSTALVLHELSSKTFTPATNGTTHQVRLRKDPSTNSFGFSVSDGVGDNAGVFINEILPGGPADRCGQILPYDKILQINDTSLQYLDCDLALPLLQVDEIEMVLYREADQSTNVVEDDDDDESYRNSVNLSLRYSAV
ncbi:PDZ domain (Also known as DHR or GLGF) family protein [Acanthocheilonema viteae]